MTDQPPIVPAPPPTAPAAAPGGAAPAKAPGGGPRPAPLIAAPKKPVRLAPAAAAGGAAMAGAGAAGGVLFGPVGVAVGAVLVPAAAAGVTAVRRQLKVSPQTKVTARTAARRERGAQRREAAKARRAAGGGQPRGIRRFRPGGRGPSTPAGSGMPGRPRPSGGSGPGGGRRGPVGRAMARFPGRRGRSAGPPSPGPHSGSQPRTAAAGRRGPFGLGRRRGPGDATAGTAAGGKGKGGGKKTAPAGDTTPAASRSTPWRKWRDRRSAKRNGGGPADTPTGTTKAQRKAAKKAAKTAPDPPAASTAPPPGRRWWRRKNPTPPLAPDAPAADKAGKGKGGKGKKAAEAAAASSAGQANAQPAARAGRPEVSSTRRRDRKHSRGLPPVPGPGPARGGWWNQRFGRTGTTTHTPKTPVPPPRGDVSAGPAQPSPATKPAKKQAPPAGTRAASPTSARPGPAKPPTGGRSRRSELGDSQWAGHIDDAVNQARTNPDAARDRWQRRTTGRNPAVSNGRARPDEPTNAWGGDNMHTANNKFARNAINRGGGDIHNMDEDFPRITSRLDDLADQLAAEATRAAAAIDDDSPSGQAVKEAAREYEAQARALTGKGADLNALSRTSDQVGYEAGDRYGHDPNFGAWGRR